jgi:hypothetical protein
MAGTLVREAAVHQHEYLSHARSRRPIRIVLDAPGGGPRIDDERRRQHVERMLQSHGLSITGE